MTDYLKYFFSKKELRSCSVSPLSAFYPQEGRLWGKAVTNVISTSSADFYMLEQSRNNQHLAPLLTNHRVHLRKLSQNQVSLLASFSHSAWWLIFKAFPFHYLQTILFCRWKAAFCFSSTLIITIWSFIRAQGLSRITIHFSLPGNFFFWPDLN